MLLRERLNQLPEQLGIVNEPTAKLINQFLITTVTVLEMLQHDLQENEPHARNTIDDLAEVIGYVPMDCGEVAEIDEGRAKEEEK